MVILNIFIEIGSVESFVNFYARESNKGSILLLFFGRSGKKYRSFKWKWLKILLTVSMIYRGIEIRLRRWDESILHVGPTYS